MQNNGTVRDCHVMKSSLAEISQDGFRGALVRGLVGKERPNVIPLDLHQNLEKQFKSHLITAEDSLLSMVLWPDVWGIHANKPECRKKSQQCLRDWPKLVAQSQPFGSRCQQERRPGHFSPLLLDFGKIWLEKSKATTAIKYLKPPHENC